MLSEKLLLHILVLSFIILVTSLKKGRYIGLHNSEIIFRYLSVYLFLISFLLSTCSLVPYQRTVKTLFLKLLSWGSFAIQMSYFWKELLQKVSQHNDSFSFESAYIVIRLSPQGGTLFYKLHRYVPLKSYGFRAVLV